MWLKAVNSCWINCGSVCYPPGLKVFVLQRCWARVKLGLSRTNSIFASLKWTWCKYRGWISIPYLIVAVGGCPAAVTFSGKNGLGFFQVLSSYVIAPALQPTPAKETYPVKPQWLSLVIQPGMWQWWIFMPARKIILIITSFLNLYKLFCDSHVSQWRVAVTVKQQQPGQHVQRDFLKTTALILRGFNV